MNSGGDDRGSRATVMTSPIESASELDAKDPLAGFRRRFLIDDPELIYLDGNSLGRLPAATVELVESAVKEQWGKGLIRSWNDGWFEAPERIGDKIGRLIGARSGEVVVADSTTVNLFKLALTALKQRPGRSRILTDDLNFPSDLYSLTGVVEALGDRHSLEVVPSADGINGPVEEIRARLDERTALLTLSHVTFKSGYLYDMVALTRAAHEVGALVLWDLSHSAGAVPVDLEAARADLAVGCSYKYLNGGPGAPAFLYVRRDLQESLTNPLPGWMGQLNPFAFELSYQPVADVRRFLTGTPPILSLLMIEPGVDLLLEAGMRRVREKSIRQTGYLIELWRQLLAPLGFSLNSPENAPRRGSHVSLGHSEGLGIDLALIREMKVIPDFRQPDNIRLGIAPLYISFSDIQQAVWRLHEVVERGLHRRYLGNAPVVT